MTNSFVHLLGYAKAYFYLHYRQAEDVVRAHATNKNTIDTRLL